MKRNRERERDFGKEDKLNERGAKTINELKFIHILFSYIAMLVILIFLAFVAMNYISMYFESSAPSLKITKLLDKGRDSTNPEKIHVPSISKEPLSLEEVLRIFVERYNARLKAMELNADTIKYGVAIAGVTVSIILGLFAYFAGRNIQANTKLVNDTVNDIRDTMERESEKIRRDLPRIIINIAEEYANTDDKDSGGENKCGKDSEINGSDTENGASIQRNAKASNKIEYIFKKMYDEIKVLVERDLYDKKRDSFDPLKDYKALSTEIEKREMATKLARMQPGAVPLEETLDDPEFRRRAAAVFRDILETVRKDEQERGARKIDPVSLFNIAAHASKMDMDFVALELMEKANEYANGPWLEEVLAGRSTKVQLHAVEAAARYVRQLLNMQRITPEEALKAIKVVLANTNEFDLHLVASEAFNIGQRIADPAGMADVIEQNLPEHLRDVSYVKFNGARLKFMGGLPEQVQEGEKMFLDGLKRFGKEPPTARWFEHSAQELAVIMTENPELALRHAEEIRQAIRKQPNARVFERVYGGRLMEALQEFGWLNDFLDEPWEKGDRGHEKSEEEFRRAFLEALLRNNDDDEKP